MLSQISSRCFTKALYSTKNLNIVTQNTLCGHLQFSTINLVFSLFSRNVLFHTSESFLEICSFTPSKSLIPSFFFSKRIPTFEYCSVLKYSVSFFIASCLVIILKIKIPYCFIDLTLTKHLAKS